MNLLKKVVVTDTPNKKWENFFRERELTLKRRPIYNASSTFFMIGSCFAEEIRKALSPYQKCYPEYQNIRFDTSSTLVDTLQVGRYHMNYYNSFSIRQEFERALGVWLQEPDDLWFLPNRKIEKGRLIVSKNESDVVYQDPYRRNIFASNKSELFDVINQINAEMRRGLEKAEVIVITLGMTEIFKIKKNGRVCNQVPLYGGGAGLRETTFHDSNFSENLDNMDSTIKAIKVINPRARIILSVSPVPLHRSFGPDDIFTNNFSSKSILRSVVSTLVQRYPDIVYFPSFEIVWGIGSDAYEDRDLLHVKPAVVREIIKLFALAHCTRGDQ
jgi:hypothetical protein